MMASSPETERASTFRARLNAWEPASSALVLDLDGTLHRGRWRWARGLSNIDWAFEIGWALRPWGLPIAPPRYTDRVIRFAIRERWTRHRWGDAPDYYRGAIEGFRERLLRPLPPDLAQRAAANLTRFAHPDLIESLQQIAPRFSRFLILSKAFQPVVDVYATWLSEALGQAVEGMGNSPLPDEPARVLAGEDKARVLVDWLERTGARSCLIVGDTRQDLAMGAAALKLLGSDQAAVAALAPKSPDFAQGANAAFASWTDLARALAPEPACQNAAAP